MQKPPAALLIEIPNRRTVIKNERDCRKEKHRQVEYHELMQTLIVTYQEQRKLHETGDDHQWVTYVACQTKEHLEFYPQRQGRIPDTAVELEPDLQDALGPAAL